MISHFRRFLCVRRFLFLSELAEYGFQHWKHSGHLAEADDQVPERLEFLPSRRVPHVAQAAGPGVLRKRSAENGAPAIEVLIGLPVSVLEFLRRQTLRLKDGVPRVVQVPVVVQDASFVFQAGSQGG
jgi:hypothetical protein